MSRSVTKVKSSKETYSYPGQIVLSPSICLSHSLFVQATLLFYVCSSVRLSVCLYVSMYLLYIYILLSELIYVCISMFLSNYLSANLPPCLSGCLSICLSVCLFVYLSMALATITYPASPLGDSHTFYLVPSWPSTYEITVNICC